MTIQHVVIIGAGQAGGELAQKLRQGGFAGDVTLIGEEPLAPYQRPPLSKKYLSGELNIDRLLLRPREVYAHENITLLTGARAVSVDRNGKRVRLEGGRELPYDVLVFATGARPRPLPLPGAALPGCFTLRTAADIDAIRPSFIGGKDLVIIGAGYIGLETAAVARTLGLNVTVIEAAARPLARVTSPEVAAFFLEEHTRQGVRFKLSSQPARIEGAERVTGVQLADGSSIAADMVIAGIGVTAETSLAQACGLAVEDGVLTDRACRTNDPAVFAIGDCARRPMAHYGGRLARLESMHNAAEGARIVAAMIMDQTPPAEEAPWFWSDQYDLKLQIAGLFQGYDQTILRGSFENRSFAMFYYHGAKLIAVDAVNAPGEYLGAKLLIQTHRSVAPEALQDMARSMKEIVATAKG